MGLLQTSRQQPSGPQIFPVVINKIGSVGGEIWDIPISLPFPCNTFFLMSIRSGDEANSIVMYLNALGYPRGFGFFAGPGLKGKEQIYYLTSNDAIGPFYYSVVKLNQPVTNFFVAIGTENGVASRYTLGCTNDEEMSIRGGIYT